MCFEANLNYSTWGCAFDLYFLKGRKPLSFKMGFDLNKLAN